MNTDKILTLVSLDDKVALITGGNSGIGLGAAQLLSDFGAKVAIVGTNDEKGRKAEMELQAKGGEAKYFHCDVRYLNPCKNVVDEVVETWGSIDILFNNAGIAFRKNAVDLNPEEWDRAIDVSLKGQYLMSKCVIPHMISNGGGSIINCGSGWSYKGGKNALSYCAMKGGSLNMTRAMCIDHGGDNIRVNIVCPGDVDTPMLRSEAAQLGRKFDQDFIDECADRPLNRLGTVEDVAKAVVFLASDMSSWISGASIVVDGGGIA